MENKNGMHFVSAPSSSIYWLQCTEVPGVNICKTNSKLAGKITGTNSKHMVLGKKIVDFEGKGLKKNYPVSIWDFKSINLCFIWELLEIN